MPMVKSLLPALLIASFFSSLSYAAAPDRVSGALTGGPTVTLRGNVQHQALPKYDQGPADPSTRFGSMTLLTMPTAAQRNALTQLLAEQQNPKSPNFRKWLMPEQWADRFGLSQKDVQTLTAWLKAQRFTIGYVARGRNWITFSGTAAQIESAFGTEIHNYNVNGELHVANATPPKIPAALAGVVTGIRGMDDFHLKPRGIRRVRPYYDSSTIGDLIAPGDIATMYDINALYNASTPIDGTGQKLAIIGQTDIYLSDIVDFRTGFGFSSITCTTNTSGIITACSDPHLQYVVADGLEDPGVSSSGDLSEADLDLEISGSVAYNAQLIFVNAPINTTTTTGAYAGGGVWDSWYYAVDQNLAPVISMSYGLCEFGDNAILTSSGSSGSDELELMKANSEGITFVNSAGDSGAAECDPAPPEGGDPNGASATGGLAVSYPASSPEVTGVGGTDIPLADFTATYWGTTNATDGGSVLSYIPEQAWNDDAEFVTFCQQQTSGSDGYLFCTQGGTTAVSGWVPITSAANVQTDFAIGSNADGISSGGGGASNCAVQNSGFTACVSGFPQPSWQTVTISSQASARFSPDVSFLASPNFPGYIFCTELSELGDSGTGSSCAPGGSAGITNALSSSLTAPSIIGGTSASGPLLAGIVTLMNQFLAVSGQGNINPTLYTLAATPSNKVFNQITTGNNLVYCTAGTPSVQPTALECPTSGVLGFNASNADATNGYNLVTGLGSIDVNNLAQALTPFTVSATAVNPASVSAGNSVTSMVTITPKNSFAGTVTLSCSGLPTGAGPCTFNPPTVVASGATQMTIPTLPNVAAGTTTVTVTGTSGAGSSKTTVSLTVTATTESFSLTPNPTLGTLTVAQGGTTGPVNLTVTSTSTPSFIVTSGTSATTALPVTYSCSGLPSESTCNFTPSSTSSQTTLTLTIGTTAPTAELRQPERGIRIFYAALLPGLLGIMFTAGSRKRSLRGVRLLGLIVVLGFSTLWLGSCGGSSGTSNQNPGTPMGTSTVTINATTGGSAPITAPPLTFQLTVN